MYFELYIELVKVYESDENVLLSVVQYSNEQVCKYAVLFSLSFFFIRVVHQVVTLLNICTLLNFDGVVTLYIA